ncbi:MAG: hypothetical protein ABSG10_12255 [Terracidiphilus sp.]|jgi:hypothetical protein
MKKSRYTEEQIIGILKQHEAGLKPGLFLVGIVLARLKPCPFKAAAGGRVYSSIL